ncbi:V-set and transmembrane domain-containing protein 5 [Camelus dromedarius]|uniref:V-set and transmembrane domain-containing protein 5 n=1 Tax=Camelus dromedarius TaxID=9838 RepID=A0A5N4DLP7_CAMDR|nr:V-set and transmembrane domain-containing protein 5 [Camelus dromedarius]
MVKTSLDLHLCSAAYFGKLPNPGDLNLHLCEVGMMIHSSPSWHPGASALLLGKSGQGVSLFIPQSAINATVEEDILLSVEYSCHGIPTIEWKYTSNWGVQKIVEWKPGTQANISQSHKDRVCTFDNGSIQLFSVGVRDSGYYVITVTESLGSSQFGTIVLHVSEILYEDLHFVAVFLAFLAAVAAVLISLMWVCNKCAYKFQRKRRHKLKESTTEEIELQDVEC